MQCEYEMTPALYRLYNELNFHASDQHLQPLQLFTLLQVSFITRLRYQYIAIPPLFSPV